MAAKPKKSIPGIGMPAALYLDEFGALVDEGLGAGFGTYHVGSSLLSKQWRDVDVRTILSDDEYAAMGLGDPDHPHQSPRWVALTLAFSALGRHMTGLPIDYQIQQQTHCNKKFPNARSALGINRYFRRTPEKSDD